MTAKNWHLIIYVDSISPGLCRDRRAPPSRMHQVAALGRDGHRTSLSSIEDALAALLASQCALLAPSRGVSSQTAWLLAKLGKLVICSHT